ncbi:hypothetical protein [Nocardioides sp. SR21]|uniref:hypothetical protein n=1 Tax=Nocardioides sp. SR21 TaxID=2919501 RepID=UPI001FA9750B|nr:hypothetical protein [Nocardioides sp. SR21]
MSINADRHDESNPRASDVRSDDGADSSLAAARLLEMTARETDQWRADAKSEAAEIVRAARDEAERLVTAAREEAERTTNDARVEAYRVRQETTDSRRRQDEEIAQLQATATEHREQLRRHLTDMLGRIDATPGDSGQ